MSQLAKVGDGTKEVIAVNTSSETPLYWYHDNAVFPAYTVPYWGRGGGVGETPYSGIFYSDSTSGGAYAGVTSRFTLAK